VSSESRKSLRAARPMGHPGAPDPAAMSKGEIEERHATVAKLWNLMERAKGGDEDAVLNIREILDGSADLAWHFIKGPGTMAESVLIDHITKDKDLASKELLKHQLESMRIEVAGENPSPLERRCNPSPSCLHRPRRSRQEPTRAQWTSDKGRLHHRGAQP
jgi:hypothetical protein